MHAKVFNLNMFLDTKKNTKGSVGDTVYISSFFPHKQDIEVLFNGIGCDNNEISQDRSVSLAHLHTAKLLGINHSILGPTIIPIINFSCKFLHLGRAWVLRGPLPHPPYKVPVGTERSISPRMEERGRSRSRFQMMFFHFHFLQSSSLSLSTELPSFDQRNNQAIS